MDAYIQKQNIITDCIEGGAILFNEVLNQALILNSTSAFLWMSLEEKSTIDKLTVLLCMKYKISEQHARASCKEFISELINAQVVDVLIDEE